MDFANFILGSGHADNFKLGIRTLLFFTKSILQSQYTKNAELVKEKPNILLTKYKTN